MKQEHANRSSTLAPRKPYSSLLSQRISFRTPRKLKEYINLPKWRVLSHSKAGFGTIKIWIERFEMLFGKLGLRKGLSSHCYPVRSTDQDGCSKSEKWVDLSQFRTFLLQHLGMTNLNFLGFRFALP